MNKVDYYKTEFVEKKNKCVIKKVSEYYIKDELEYSSKVTYDDEAEQVVTEYKKGNGADWFSVTEDCEFEEAVFKYDVNDYTTRALGIGEDYKNLLNYRVERKEYMNNRLIYFDAHSVPKKDFIKEGCFDGHFELLDKLEEITIGESCKVKNDESDIEDNKIYSVEDNLIKLEGPIFQKD